MKRCTITVYNISSLWLTLTRNVRKDNSFVPCRIDNIPTVFLYFQCTNKNEIAEFQGGFHFSRDQWLRPSFSFFVEKYDLVGFLSREYDGSRNCYLDAEHWNVRIIQIAFNSLERLTLN